MKNLFVLIGIMLFLSSCDRPEYFNIPKNKKPILKNSDTVFFIDRVNQYSDTFLIKIIDDYRVSDKNYYQEFIDLSYQKIGKQSTFKYFYIQQSASPSISIGNNYFSTYGNVDPISITINKINYQSVFVKHAVNFPDSIPNTVYYSYKYGIIRYEFSDGRYYELNSKID